MTILVISTLTGTKTTIRNIDQPTKALKELNNSSLVNMSTSSALNRSRHVQRVLDMVTPIKVKLARSASMNNTTMNNTTMSNTTMSNTTKHSRHVMRVLDMVTPIKVKQERLKRTKALETSTRSAQILDVTHAQEKSEVTEAVKEERQEVTLKRNFVSDSSYSASPSKRHRFEHDSVLSSTHLGEAPSVNTSLRRVRSNHLRSVISSITPIKVKQDRLNRSKALETSSSSSHILDVTHAQMKQESCQHVDIPPPHYSPRPMADASRLPNCNLPHQSHHPQPCQGPCRCGHCEHSHMSHRQSYHPASSYRPRRDERDRLEDRYSQYPADNSSTYNRNIGYLIGPILDGPKCARPFFRTALIMDARGGAGSACKLGPCTSFKLIFINNFI